MHYDHLLRRGESWMETKVENCGYCFGKGGDPAPAPDYSPMAAASAESARLGKELGDAQLAENRRQYDLNMEVAQPVIDAQLKQMNDAGEQAKDYYDYSKETFRPIEQGLADEAESGSSRYDTNAGVRANVEQEASRAAADVSRASDNSEQQNSRALMAMGVNPNSGKFAAMKTSTGLQNAAMRSAAMTGARQKGVQLDYAKRLDVTGLGRGLAGASTAAYGVATNSGNSAVGAQNGTSGQYMNGMSGGNGLIMQGQGQAIQGLGSILSSQTSGYNSALSASASESASNGQMIGAGVGAVAVMI